MSTKPAKAALAQQEHDFKATVMVNMMYADHHLRGVASTLLSSLANAGDLNAPHLQEKKTLILNRLASNPLLAKGVQSMCDANRNGLVRSQVYSDHEFYQALSSVWTLAQVVYKSHTVHVFGYTNKEGTLVSHHLLSFQETTESPVGSINFLLKSSHTTDPDFIAAKKKAKELVLQSLMNDFDD